jgi:hypothetical protein
LKQEFDNKCSLYLRQLEQQAARIRELESINADLKQRNLNYAEQITGNIMNQNRKIHEQLTKIMETIEETPRKRPKIEFENEETKQKQANELEN